MWKLRIGVLLVSGVFALGLCSAAWARTGSGPTNCGSCGAETTISLTTTTIGGVKTSISAIRISRPQAHTARKRREHRKPVRPKP